MQLPLRQNFLFNLRFNYRIDNMRRNIRFHWWARANEIFVSMSVIDSTYAWPKLGISTNKWSRKSSNFSRIRAVPRGIEYLVKCVWSHLQRINTFIPPILFDFFDLLSNENHGIAKTIKLRFGFRFGWPVTIQSVVVSYQNLEICNYVKVLLDHESAGHRPRHGRCMKAIVHQPLGNINCLNSGAFLERTYINNELVSH